MLERVLQHAGSKTARCFCVIRNPVMNGATKSHDPGCMMNHMMTRGHMIFRYEWIASWFHICMSRPFGICILNGTLWEEDDEDAEPPLVSSPNDHDQKRAILGMLLLLKLWGQPNQSELIFILLSFCSPPQNISKYFPSPFFLSPTTEYFSFLLQKIFCFASPNISPRFLLLFKRFFPSTKFFRFSSLSPKKYFPSPNVFRFLVYLAINEPKIIWLLSIIGENMPLVCWDQACETSLSNQKKRKGKKNLVLNQSVRLWQHFIV